MQTVLEIGETVCQDSNLLVVTSSLDITYTILMQVQAQCCAKVMETKVTDFRQLFA